MARCSFFAQQANCKASRAMALVFLLGLSPAAFSQTTAPWFTLSKTDQLAIHLHQSTDFFGTPQSISYLKIYPSAKIKMTVAYLDTTLLPLPALAAKQGALAGINGSFFNMKKGGSVVFLKANGEVVGPSFPEVPAHIDGAGVGTDLQGRIRIVRKPAMGWQSVASQFTELMVAGPLLLWENEIVVADTTAFHSTQHPRSAVGLTDAEELLLLTVDGRHSEAAGMSTTELATLMRDLGCKYALNLDGGGSTTLWHAQTGVLNYPSDNRQFDHDGARPIANALLFSLPK